MCPMPNGYFFVVDSLHLNLQHTNGCGLQGIGFQDTSILPSARLQLSGMNAWGAGWKRNIGKLKTENNRRMKIIKFVQELAALPGWSVDLATTFLSEQYEPRYKARAFSDYLTKDNRKNKPAVLKAADLYLKQRRQRCT
ncbi:hypothetical protein FB451DRAFT_1181418 [Mycena latifolia]|nr:hypothetical protein FB451DRAFT_1181418 [Mycena latifolia]